MTIDEGNSTDEEIHSCFSYTWVDGVEYFEDNDEATFTYSNIHGCDSIVTLNLEITILNLDITVSAPDLIAVQYGSLYQWLDCENDFEPIIGANSQTFTPEEYGTYAVELILNGCIDTTDCIEYSLSGVAGSFHSKPITVHPNPFSYSTTINFGEGLVKKHTILIHDLLGKEIYRNDNVTGKSLEVRKNEMVAGTYLLTLYNSDLDVIYMQKLIIEQEINDYSFAFGSSFERTSKFLIL